MLTADERNRRTSEGIKLAWKRRKAEGFAPKKSPEGARTRRLKKIALYLKYLAHLIEEEANEVRRPQPKRAAGRNRRTNGAAADEGTRA